MTSVGKAFGHSALSAALRPCFFWVLLGFAVNAIAEDPWGDAVVQYNPGVGASAPYIDPSKALGAPTGLGPTLPNNNGIVSLGGVGGVLVLKFNTPVTDDAANPMGLDCIVYSNTFWNGGNPQRKFQEPALIEISEDANGNGLADDPWYLIPGSRDFAYVPFPSSVEPAGLDNLSPNPVTLLGGNITNPNALDGDSSNNTAEYNWGYAEMNPTQLPYLDNYVRPDDPKTVGLTHRSGGGDAFDIAWAVDGAGALAHLTRFHFVRLTSLVDRSMTGLGVVSPEIDAAADVAPDIDVDGDGILDEYETRVAGTDPARRESTVLPLEIPSSEGGSSNGTVLGLAEDIRGTQVRLFSAGARSGSGRAFNATIDILVSSAPIGSLPGGGLIKSALVRQVQSSITDFIAAGIQAAQITVQYQSAEITGLDENALQPYRYENGAYTQNGISAITRTTTLNKVAFTTQYPGTFILAGPAGVGDVEVTEGAHGAIALAATPNGQCAANPANSVQVSSGPIQNTQGAPVPDGTLITVSTTSGDITTTDLDSVTPGIQVASVGGAVTFAVRAPREARASLFRAASVQGDAYGDLWYAFVPGPPASTISWTIGPPQGEGPVELEVESSSIHDATGNAIPDGTLITVTVSDGTILSGDADLAQPGHQAIVSQGILTLSLSVPNRNDFFQINTFVDPARTQRVSSTTLAAGFYDSMPLAEAPLVLVPFLAWLGARGAVRRVQRNRR